jgi:hypothetical protein
MDGRKNNKGKIGNNGGRPPKEKEQTLIEKLSPYDDTALKVLFQNISDGEKWAIELFFKYRFGMPKQQIDHTTNGESIQTNINYSCLSDATLTELAKQDRPSESESGT